ncbi:unnamed protein product [Clavelina lepadiformis]|uniref:Uncharacterized protein n=1 Tax=Clavelina lepadiformis TaxID=159417 RepID=A0ABP0FV17_CLALP
MHRMKTGFTMLLSLLAIFYFMLMFCPIAPIHGNPIHKRRNLFEFHSSLEGPKSSDIDNIPVNSLSPYYENGGQSKESVDLENFVKSKLLDYMLPRDLYEPFLDQENTFSPNLVKKQDGYPYRSYQTWANKPLQINQESGSFNPYLAALMPPASKRESTMLYNNMFANSRRHRYWQLQQQILQSLINSKKRKS